MNPDQLAELEDQRRFLKRSLDDLEQELAAGDIDAVDAATLRADYARRLAHVEQAIHTGHVAELQQRPRRKRSRAVIGAVMVAVLAVGAGVAVAQTAGTRKPGETPTGEIRQSSADKLNQAAGLQDQGKYLEAVKLYDAVIKSDPRNGEALAERGFLLLRLSMGNDQPKLVDDGSRYVERALAVEPDNPRWLFYRAVGLRLQGKDAEASQAFDDALAADPPADLRDFITQFRKSISG